MISKRIWILLWLLLGLYGAIAVIGMTGGSYIGFAVLAVGFMLGLEWGTRK